MIRSITVSFLSSYNFHSFFFFFHFSQLNNSSCLNMRYSFVNVFPRETKMYAIISCCMLGTLTLLLLVFSCRCFFLGNLYYKYMQLLAAPYWVTLTLLLLVFLDVFPWESCTKSYTIIICCYSATLTLKLLVFSCRCFSLGNLY